MAPTFTPPTNPEHRTQQQQLVDAVRFLHARGWAPATSSNYSIRVNPGTLCISRSGVDKQYFTDQDLMYVDSEGTPLWPQGARPSAETDLHIQVYEHDSAVQCVLHTHSAPNTVLSLRYETQGFIYFQGFELQKAIGGCGSHEHQLRLPVFGNTQTIPHLAMQVQQRWAEHPEMSGYLIAGHGLYAWGRTVAEAKRHAEAWEFLLECRLHQDAWSRK